MFYSRKALPSLLLASRNLSIPHPTCTIRSISLSRRMISSSYPRPIWIPNRDSLSEDDPRRAEVFEDDTDVVIVGAGPAGLAAAIRLKQLAQDELRVMVVEKAGELGAHTLSGAVLEPRALNELIPDWQERGAPLHTPVTSDSMQFLTRSMSLPLPLPPTMDNHGNYVISLSNFVKWLGEQAEELGVEIYPGFGGSELRYHPDGSVAGVQLNDLGLDKNFKPKDNYERGMAINAKVTLLAEGCHGSLTKTLINKFNLRKDRQPQKYGIGLKEVWEIDPAKHDPGKVVHTIGWPLSFQTYGGGFLYHFEAERHLVSIGYVVGLDYNNPFMNPYKEFQQFKLHPSIKPILEGGQCISYGARALNEGGYQSIPKLTFPGGALIGCTAGFLNVPKIKGTHTAMKTGMMAAEATYERLLGSTKEQQQQGPILLDNYETAFNKSWVHDELYAVRNCKPSFHTALGIYGGLLYSGISTMITKGREPWTFKHGKPDWAELDPAAICKPIPYPRPDGKITFDLLTNVSRTGTNHAEDQPSHLRLRDKDVPVERNLAVYDGPESRFCPAGVYEFVDDEARPGQKRLQINSQNCIHCKTCDIKDPSQNIDWTVPEGGDGPKYVWT